jgi:hypothetical protein
MALDWLRSSTAMHDWSRGERFAFYGLIIAVIGILVGLLSHEIRRAFGLSPEIVMLTAQPLPLTGQSLISPSPSTSVAPPKYAAQTMESLPQSQPVPQNLLGASTAQDLSGEWTLLDTVNSTSYNQYTNMQLGFRLFINQTGSNFTAEGEKSSLNGRALPSSQRTAIHVTGSIEGERVVATFVEDGIRRQNTGTFTWTIENGGRLLRGRFISAAANSSGASIMTKER